jgi:hypothetical protein
MTLLTREQQAEILRQVTGVNPTIHKVGNKVRLLKNRGIADYYNGFQEGDICEIVNNSVELLLRKTGTTKYIYAYGTEVEIIKAEGLEL